MKAMYNTMIVNDMEESVAFYKDICGFEIDSVYDLPNGAQITLLKSGEHTFVELIKDDVHEVGYYSIGMDVEDIETIDPVELMDENAFDDEEEVIDEEEEEDKVAKYRAESVFPHIEGEVDESKDSAVG